MKKRTAASTILISLVAAGCGHGDGEYVEYQNTAPSEPEKNLGQTTEPLMAPGADKQVLTSEYVDDKPALATDAPSTESSVKPASHVVKSTETTDSTDAAPAGDGNPDSSAKLIVSSQSGLTGTADVPQVDKGVPETANKIDLLIPYKSFRRERGTEAVRISYDDIDLLKVLNMEPVPTDAPKYFPEWLAGLNGKRVRIRGWMYPTFASEGLTQFTMARDNGICCFQRMPKIYDVIFVKLAKGQKTDYIAQRPFDIEGTFRIDSEGDGSELPRLYKIDDARVLD